MKATEYIGNREEIYLSQRQMIETNSFRKQVLNFFWIIGALIVFATTPSNLWVVLMIIFAAYHAIKSFKVQVKEGEQIRRLNKEYKNNPGSILLSQLEEMAEFFPSDYESYGEENKNDKKENDDENKDKEFNKKITN